MLFFTFLHTKYIRLIHAEHGTNHSEKAALTFKIKESDDANFIQRVCTTHEVRAERLSKVKFMYVLVFGWPLLAPDPPQGSRSPLQSDHQGAEVLTKAEVKSQQTKRLFVHVTTWSLTTAVSQASMNDPGDVDLSGLLVSPYCCSLKQDLCECQLWTGLLKGKMKERDRWKMKQILFTAERQSNILIKRVLKDKFYSH